MEVKFKKVIEHFKKYNKYSKYAAKSELKGEVANSYLTWLWWILDPLFFMLVYTFIVELVFKTKEPYFPVFVFAGLTIWNFFNKNVSISVKIVSAFKGIVSNIYIPKYMLILEKMYVNLVKMIISYALLIGLMLLFKVEFTIYILYSIPLLILAFIFTFAVSTVMAHFGVFIEDLSNVVQVVLRLLFYLSGIFYSITNRLSETLSTIMLRVNPIAYIIEDFRNVTMYGQSINFGLYFYWLAISIIIAIIGIKIMYKYENSYIKVI